MLGRVSDPRPRYGFPTERGGDCVVMGTADDAKEKAQAGGERLDEAVEKAGAALEDKVAPVAEKIADKVVDVTDRSTERETQ
jgi:hypothetical protein